MEHRREPQGHDGVHPGSSPARKVDDASARDVDRSELPKKDAVGDRPSVPEEEEEEEEEELPPEIASAMDDNDDDDDAARR